MSKLPKLIVFLVMDTARYRSFDFESDRVNPRLNSFIRDHNALNFKRAISAAPWTIPSHVSMFSGKLPSEHGCIDYGFKVDKEINFLPKLMQSSGYHTAGITSNGLLTRSSNFNFGFNDYICTWNLFQDLKEPYRSSNIIKKEGFLGLIKVLKYIFKNKPVKSILNLIYRNIFSVKKDSTPFTIKTTELAKSKIRDCVKKDKKLFLFINYMQPHMDYNPPEPFRSKFTTENINLAQSPVDFYSGKYTDKDISSFNKLYKSEISFLDSQVGDLLSCINKEGLMDDSAIVITSDHGEHIGEHGHISHYFSVYNETIHVPLIMKLPEKNNQILANPDLDFVSTMDLYGILCGLIMQGKGKSENNSFRKSSKPIISELYMPSEYSYFIESCKKINPNFSKEEFIQKGMQNQKSIFHDSKKFIIREKGNNEVYSQDDICENLDLASKSKEILGPVVNQYSFTKKKGTKSSKSDKMKDRLRNLGYY